MENYKPQNAMTEKNTRDIFGDDIVDKLLAQNCDFTNRVLPESFDVAEMSATIELPVAFSASIEPQRLVIYYYVDNKEIEQSDGDLGNCDYSNYCFVAI